MPIIYATMMIVTHDGQNGMEKYLSFQTKANTYRIAFSVPSQMFSQGKIRCVPLREWAKEMCPHTGPLLGFC